MHTKTIYNGELKILKEDFLKAQETYRLTGNQEDKAEAARKKKIYDLKLKKLRREASSEHIAQASNKSKTMWDIINSERKAAHETSEATITCLKIGEQEEADTTKIANNIISFFQKIVEDTLSTGHYTLHT